MSAYRPLLMSLLVAPLVACGLDRPIEPQPLVSVLDQWRAQVLAENASRIDGEPLDVVSGEFSGDFGRLGWDSPLMAETQGMQSKDLVVVELLAGGGESRWGMAIVGLYLPPLEELEPGVRTIIEPSDATVIGCSGVRLFDWDIDTAAEITTVEVEVDAADPTLEHYEFEGLFANGTILEGRFSVQRPKPQAAQDEGSAFTP